MSQAKSDGHEMDKVTRMAMALADHGFDDVVVLRRAVGAKLLTEKRRELIDHLKENDPESVRALARALDRDKSGVSRDLALLAEHQVVEFEEVGAAKAPRLATNNVVIEPLV